MCVNLRRSNTGAARKKPKTAKNWTKTQLVLELDCIRSGLVGSLKLGNVGSCRVDCQKFLININMQFTRRSFKKPINYMSVVMADDFKIIILWMSNVICFSINF